MWKLRIKWLFWLALGFAIITSLFSNVWVQIVLCLFWAFIVFGGAERDGVI